MQRPGYAIAMMGGALGLVNVPLASLASAAAYRDLMGLPAQPPPAALAPLLLFSDPDTVYGAFGAVWIPVAAMLLAGAWALRARRRDELPRFGQRGLDLVVVGLALAIPGNLGDYVLGRMDAPWAFAASAVGFSITMLGVLAYVVGAVLAAVALLRARAGPPAAAWALAAAPLAIPATMLVQNAPAGPFLVVCGSWVVAGALWRREPPR